MLSLSLSDPGTSIWYFFFGFAYVHWRTCICCISSLLLNRYLGYRDVGNWYQDGILYTFGRHRWCQEVGDFVPSLPTRSVCIGYICKSLSHSCIYLCLIVVICAFCITRSCFFIYETTGIVMMNYIFCSFCSVLAYHLLSCLHWKHIQYFIFMFHIM